MQGTKARRGKTLQPHKMNMRMNIYTYTHENKARTNIYYIHTDNTA